MLHKVFQNLRLHVRLAVIRPHAKYRFFLGLRVRIGLSFAFYFAQYVWGFRGGWRFGEVFGFLEVYVFAAVGAGSGFLFCACEE